MGAANSWTYLKTYNGSAFFEFELQGGTLIPTCQR
jgi:hypothetical protein